MKGHTKARIARWHWLSIALLLVSLTGCSSLSPALGLLEPEQEAADTTPEAQPREQVEVVVVDPTPTTVPTNRDAVAPLLFVSSRGKAGNTWVRPVSSAV